jgi:hypothetical protein
MCACRRNDIQIAALTALLYERCGIKQLRHKIWRLMFYSKRGFALVRITLWRLEDARSKQNASVLHLFDRAHTTYKSTSKQDLAVIEHHYVGFLGNSINNHHKRTRKLCCIKIQDFSKLRYRAIRRLRKMVKTDIFVISCTSVAWKKSTTTERIVMLFVIWRFFENMSRRVKFEQNLTWITGTSSNYLHACTFMIITRWNLLRIGSEWDKFVDKVKTHFIFNNFSPKIVPFIPKYG